MKRRNFLLGATAGAAISTLDWLRFFKSFGVPGTKKELGFLCVLCGSAVNYRAVNNSTWNPRKS